MSKRYEELISAHFDGETSNDERAEIERDHRSEVDRDVAAWKTLSTLISDLPQQKAPEGFTESVLAAVGESPVIAAPRNRMLGRIAVAVASAAAAVLIAVSFFPNSGTQYGSEVALSEHRTAEMLAAEYGNGVLTDEMKGSGHSDGTKLGDKKGKANVTPSPKVADNNNSAGGYKFVGDLNTLQVGDIVDAVSQTDEGHVAVVQLAVVDRSQGAAALKLLLQKLENNEIRSDLGSSVRKIQAFKGDRRNQRTEGGDKKEEKSTDKDAGEEILAVYVEAPPKQLAKAFLDLQSELKEQTLLAQVDVSSQLGIDKYYYRRARPMQRNFGGGAGGGAVFPPAAGPMANQGSNPLPLPGAAPPSQPDPVDDPAKDTPLGGKPTNTDGMPETVSPTKRDGADTNGVGFAKNPRRTRNKVAPGGLYLPLKAFNVPRSMTFQQKMMKTRSANPSGPVPPLELNAYARKQKEKALFDRVEKLSKSTRIRIVFVLVPPKGKKTKRPMG